MKNNKGITLIALIITIIVMLILAAVAITLATGNGGIIEKLINARKNYLIKQFSEELENVVAEEKIDAIADGRKMNSDTVGSLLRDFKERGDYDFTYEPIYEQDNEITEFKVVYLEENISVNLYNYGGQGIKEDGTEDEYTMFYGSISKMLESQAFRSEYTSDNAKSLSEYSDKVSNTLYVDYFQSDLYNDIENISSITDLTTFEQKNGIQKNWDSNSDTVMAINSEKTKIKWYIQRDDNEHGTKIVDVYEGTLTKGEGEQYFMTVSLNNTSYYSFVYIPSDGSALYFPFINIGN